MSENEGDTKEIIPVKAQSVITFNRDFILGVLAILIVTGAIGLTALRVDLPTWLVMAVTSVIVYFFGFISNQSKS